MTPEQQRLAAAYLAEMWAPCPELSRGERAAKRQADWEARVALADRSELSTDGAQDVDSGTAA